MPQQNRACKANLHSQTKSNKLPKVAFIQFGIEKDVSAGFDKIIVAKQQCNEIRMIDALQISPDDKSFLSSEGLAQIIVIGHSSSVTSIRKNKYKFQIIPGKERKIGSADLLTVADIMTEYAETTTALKYSFYPCELADKDQLGSFVDEPSNLTDCKVKSEDIIVYTVNIQNHSIKLDQLGNNYSSFDYIVSKMLAGFARNKKMNPYQSIVLGSQVGPGDPQAEGVSNCESPRASLKRYEADRYLNSTGSECKEISNEISKRREQEEVNGKFTIVWDSKTIILSPEASVDNTELYMKNRP